MILFKNPGLFWNDKQIPAYNYWDGKKTVDYGYTIHDSKQQVSTTII